MGGTGVAVGVGGSGVSVGVGGLGVMGVGVGGLGVDVDVSVGDGGTGVGVGVTVPTGMSPQLMLSFTETADIHPFVPLGVITWSQSHGRVLAITSSSSPS